MAQNTGNLIFFALIGGGGAGCFILWLNFASTFLENENINYRQLCLYCAGNFLLERENGSEKRKTFSFLIAKMYGITQQLLARVFSTKWE